MITGRLIKVINFISKPETKFHMEFLVVEHHDINLSLFNSSFIGTTKRRKPHGKYFYCSN